MAGRTDAKSKLSRGFSLLELSLALVIIALLSGGVIIGNSLVHQAKMRFIINQTKAYEVAVRTFRIKFHALPGDMSNATDFWEAADGGDGVGADCTSIDSTGQTATCNGNGDGKIAIDDTMSDEMDTMAFKASAPSDRHEAFRFWQHLANAGLINGSFSGRSGPNGPRHAKIGESVPALDNAGRLGIQPMFNGGIGSGPINYSILRNQYYIIGGQSNWYEPRFRNLTPDEVYSLDSKADDGLPAKGLWIVRGWSNCTDSSNSYDLDGRYISNNQNESCGFFRLW